MAIETVFRYKGKKKGDESFLREKLSHLNYHVDKFDDGKIFQYTVIFKNKYVWIDYFNESNSDYNYIIAKYSSEFNEIDIEEFIATMLSLGFELDEENSFQDNNIELNSKSENNESSIHKTHEGKNYTQEEWEAYEKKLWEDYKKKGK